MTKRATRAQRLMPSFLVVAGLVGCSGRSIGDNPGDGGAGGNSGSGGSGGMVSQGGSKGDLVCPEDHTTDSRACAVEGMGCIYVGGECTVELFCEAGVWEDHSPSCNPPELVDCPEKLPTAGSRCDEDDFVEYPEECAYAVAGCGRVVATCHVLPGTWNLQGSCAEGGAPNGAGAAGESAGGAWHEGGAGAQGGSGG